MNWKAFHRYFFFLLLVFLPTQLGKHVWPEWAFVLGRRVDYLSPTVYLTDVFLFLTVFSWFLSSSGLTRGSMFLRLDSRLRGNDKKGMANEKQKMEDDKQRKSTRKTFLLAGSIFCFTGLNILFSASPMVAIYHWVKVLEYALLVIYIMKTKPHVQTIVFPFSIGVIYSSAIAIAQFVLQHSIGGPLWLLGERTFQATTPGIAKTVLCQFSKFGCTEVLRTYGTFPHPNVLGGYLATLLPLLIFNLKFEIFNQLGKFSIRQAVSTAAIILGVIALVLTFSRSAIVIALTMTVVSSWKLVAGKKFFAVAIPLFILITSYFLLPTFSFRDESVVVRQQLNDAAIKQFISAPLVGVGLGNFLVELPKTLPTKGVYFLQPVHNIYLLVLSEIGVVGGIGIVGGIWGFWNKHKTKKSLSPISYSLVAIFLLGLVDHYPLTLQQGQLLLAVFLGIFLTTNS